MVVLDKVNFSLSLAKHLIAIGPLPHLATTARYRLEFTIANGKEFLLGGDYIE